MRIDQLGHTGICGALRACLLAVGLACVLCAGAVLGQPALACASEVGAQEVQAASTFISKPAALAIALDHAGLKKRQVTGAKVRFGSYKGKKAYMVVFLRKHVRYEHCIRAKNGKVLFYSATRA